jgi:hypothetical protein
MGLSNELQEALARSRRRPRLQDRTVNQEGGARAALLQRDNDTAPADDPDDSIDPDDSGPRLVVTFKEPVGEIYALPADQAQQTSVCCPHTLEQSSAPQSPPGATAATVGAPQIPDLLDPVVLRTSPRVHHCRLTWRLLASPRWRLGWFIQHKLRENVGITNLIEHPFELCEFRAIMDSFTYISVLLSIVLGLAVTQVLLGFRGLILTRAKVKLYTTTLIWAILALLTPIQAWWADFAMRKQPNWTFLSLLVIMLQAISIYMVAALVLPDISAEKFVDLREHFFAHRSWFFGAQLASTVFSLSKTLTLSGHLPNLVDSAFEFTFCAAAIAGAVIRSEWFHKLLAPVAGLLVAVYIALLFARL